MYVGFGEVEFCAMHCRRYHVVKIVDIMLSKWQAYRTQHSACVFAGMKEVTGTLTLNRSAHMPSSATIAAIAGERLPVRLPACLNEQIQSPYSLIDDRIGVSAFPFVLC